MTINNSEVITDIEVSGISDSRFMVANTQSIPYQLLKQKCTIPVFAKDNESTISHQELIDIIGDAASLAFPNERILDPAVRVSHPIKGRIPSAVAKPANELREHEKTIYYERMAFVYEIPSIEETVNGNRLSLTVGGVRAYNLENLYGRKSEERFKVFVGFKNWLCVNLCVSTDGLQGDLRARTTQELLNRAFQLFAMFNAQKHLNILRNLADYGLNEHQFAQLIGRLRMYPYLKSSLKIGIPALELGDSQVNTVIRDYYKDTSFCRDSEGNISLWKLYNLLTGANKSSYIDTFLDRTVNALSFTQVLLNSLKNGQYLWYLDGQ
ncbi:MAG TPA: DUF3871 family protein [Candidatus Cloacimonadota bacterium]|nr:DUF3871 family protein [Candidatus Cloacimonadota bacterium]